MYVKTICFLFLLAVGSLSAQDKLLAYQVFDKNPKKVEFHNNAIAHWLEIQLTESLYQEKYDGLILEAEIFESDNQFFIDEFMQDLVSEKKFEDECRLWNNYSTDYKPIIRFTQSNNILFFATNVSRHYASVVYEKGFEGLSGLSKESKLYIAPLPMHYNSKQDAYKSMMTMIGMHGRVNENLPKSQALKDATMAPFIHQNYKKSNLFLHFNGAYHSDNVNHITPEDCAKVDYIIMVNQSITNTY